MEPRKRAANECARRRMKKCRAIRRAISDLSSNSDDTDFNQESSEAGSYPARPNNDSNMTEEEHEQGYEQNEEVIEDESEQSERDEVEVQDESEQEQQEVGAEDGSDQEQELKEDQLYYSAEDSDVDDDIQEGDNDEDLIWREKEDEVDEISELRKWAIECNICQSHLDKLLLILRQRLLPDLPKSSKSFLKTTSAMYNIEKSQDSHGAFTSEFVYFGVANGLKTCINSELHTDDAINLQINIDGLPLYRSSTKQFWPILSKIDFNPDIYQPFPVAIYSGEEKPKSIDEYLEKFIEEMNLLQEHGLLIDGRTFHVKIKCFIADTPARTYIKCTKGHGGYAACERCTVYGQRCNRRVVYSSTECPERSNATFRAAEQREHHNGISPLTRLKPDIDMIGQFVLDFMHLCCLGVMKKLLNFWLQGNLNFRLSRFYKIKLSDRMKHLRSQVPCEFERKPRSIFDIAYWKATEFRFILLYCGPIVLKDIISLPLYKHFLLLHVSCRVLSTEALCLEQKYLDTVRIYLKNFFLLTREHYGAESQIMNLHNLIHLVSDVENMQAPVSRFTAFPFENLLGKLKRMLRSGNRPLAQICRRVHEAFFVHKKKITLPPEVQILKQGAEDAYDYISISKLKYRGFTLTTTAPDNYVLTNTEEIVKIERIFMRGEVIAVMGKKWRTKRSLFTYPCDSKILKQWELEKQPSSTTQIYNLQSIASKMVILSIEENHERFYAMPLLHT